MVYRQEKDAGDIFNQLYRESLFKSYTLVNRLFAISLTPFRAKIKSRRDKLLVGSGSQALALYRFPASALLN